MSSCVVGLVLIQHGGATNFLVNHLNKAKLPVNILAFCSFFLLVFWDKFEIVLTFNLINLTQNKTYIFMSYMNDLVCLRICRDDIFFFGWDMLRLYRG